MPTKKQFNQAKRLLKQANQVVKQTTGKGIRAHLKTGLTALFDTVDSKVTEMVNPVEEKKAASTRLQAAYATLHCQESDEDSKIRELFQTLVKEFHPELGSHPDQIEFYKIVDSYNRVMQDRHPEFNKETQE